MRLGRGERCTLSRASIIVVLRLVSAPATPRCSPIFSNPASNLVPVDHLGSAKLVAVVDPDQIVGLAAADAEELFNR